MEVNFSLSEIDTTARELLTKSGNHRVFAFHGEMGAGKTTFINALCRAMEVEDIVSSPTFSILQNYSLHK